MGVGSSCTAGTEGGSGLWFSVLAGLGWCSMLARPCTGRGGGKGMFASGEGVVSRAGGMEASCGSEGEASWVSIPSVFEGAT